MRIVLIGTYELGRQPFGLASSAAWLRAEGWSVTCNDLAVEQLDEEAVARADFIAVHVPMHTATRLAAALIPRLKALNSTAKYCAYGLYAPMNRGFLNTLGVHAVIGGEFEESLVMMARRLANGSGDADQDVQVEPFISLNRLNFIPPLRSGLPPLERYARVELPGGTFRTVGYTEASRGCKHTCRHCPVVPVYGGRFRIVPQDVVLADIEQQIEMGAQHITFGDPDFLNAPGHALPLLVELHRRFPQVSYDATIKVEHLRRYGDKLQVLRDTGCLFITTAVESIDDRILSRFAKFHTRADFVGVVEDCQKVGLTLNPTFVTFTPWTTITGYLELLDLLAELNLVPNVSPIQYAIRLLIPSGSLLLELPEMADIAKPYDPESLTYPWAHPDPRVDQLQVEVLHVVTEAEANNVSRAHSFARVRNLTLEACGLPTSPSVPSISGATEAIAHLSEPWYCCAEPSDGQMAALLPNIETNV